jgi:hypothetical protein
MYIMSIRRGGSGEAKCTGTKGAPPSKDKTSRVRQLIVSRNAVDRSRIARINRGART